MRLNPLPILAAIAALSAAGCEAPFGIGSAWVEGDWLYDATARSGSGVSCELTGVTLSLEQEGDAFAGTASGGEIVCFAGLSSSGASFGTHPVTRGTVEGDDVAFDFRAGDITHAGTVTGRSMTGTVAWTLDLGGPLGVVTLTGTFAAARVPNDD